MNTTSDAKSVIRIRDLRRTYQMGSTTVDALAGVDMEVQGNEYLAIMGPSGSGKTTLMNLIGLLDSPTGGSYELNGTLVSSLSCVFWVVLESFLLDASSRVLCVSAC